MSLPINPTSRLGTVNSWMDILAELFTTRTNIHMQLFIETIPLYKIRLMFLRLMALLECCSALGLSKQGFSANHEKPAA